MKKFSAAGFTAAGILVLAINGGIIGGWIASAGDTPAAPNVIGVERTTGETTMEPSPSPSPEPRAATTAPTEPTVDNEAMASNTDPSPEPVGDVELAPAPRPQPTPRPAEARTVETDTAPTSATAQATSEPAPADTDTPPAAAPPAAPPAGTPTPKTEGSECPAGTTRSDMSGTYECRNSKWVKVGGPINQRPEPVTITADEAVEPAAAEPEPSPAE